MSQNDGIPPEHALINELIVLMCKGGCESLVGNFQRQPRERWSDADIGEAIGYVRYMNEYFGKPEAIAVITALIAKFHVSLSDVSFPKDASDKVGLES